MVARRRAAAAPRTMSRVCPPTRPPEPRLGDCPRDTSPAPDVARTAPSGVCPGTARAYATRERELGDERRRVQRPPGRLLDRPAPVEARAGRVQPLAEMPPDLRARDVSPPDVARRRRGRPRGGAPAAARPSSPRAGSSGSRPGRPRGGSSRPSRARRGPRACGRAGTARPAATRARSGPAAGRA